MPTPDDIYGGTTDAELLLLRDSGQDPAAVGEVRNNAGELKAQDALGVFNLRSGTGISAADHRTLRQLIHFIDDGPAAGFTSGAYQEITDQPFPTNVTWYVDVTKAEKLVSLDITRDERKLPTTEVWKMYDTDGSTVLETVTDSIVYDGVFEINRTRSIA